MSALLLAAALVAGAAPAERTLTAPGPLAPLSATMLDAGKRAPVVVIIPGSGPTDRDGNNPMGVTAASYRCPKSTCSEATRSGTSGERTRR